MRLEETENRLRTLLRSGARKSPEIAKALGISQPTVSRLIQRLSSEILRLDSGKKTQYAMPRRIGGDTSLFPVFQVDTAGNVRSYGTLHTLEGNQYYWSPASGPGRLYDHVPWFIQALRPEGFVGRAFAQKYHEPGIPNRLTDWNDDHLLVMLSRHGSDLPGDLMVGNPSLAAYLEAVQKADAGLLPDDRALHYPRLAEEAMAGDPAGSSAGGEQPKFGAILRGESHPNVLVKFSPAVGTPGGRRWADLLICEHLALASIRNAGYRTATTRIFEFEDRVFLESDRFDRVGEWGRIGAVSLEVVEDEFSGLRDNWCAAAERLERLKLLPATDAHDICWLHTFGKLIANTDLHFGNITLFVQDDGTFRLAPVYDMLPMLYRPTATGEILARFHSLPSGPVDAPNTWDSALEAAGNFWKTVVQDPRISSDFHTISQEHLERAEALRAGPRLRF
jgi:biotin operon repressor